MTGYFANDKQQLGRIAGLEGQVRKWKWWAAAALFWGFAAGCAFAKLALTGGLL